jgi:nicotinate-nucleotide adenylyltransferase
VSGIGVFGGAFDPPHNGHVELARRAAEHFELDGLDVVVMARPGHRKVHLDPETRLRLAERAFPYRVHLAQSERTIDMLREPFGSQWPNRSIFLIGADQFRHFLEWKEPDALLELVRLGVATRPGFPRERLENVLRALSRPERVEFFEIEPVDVSSTEVRARAARSEPIDDLVPADVARMIREEGLYHPGPGIH